MALPRIHLHLLTCFLLMLTAGGLLLANLHSRPSRVYLEVDGVKSNPPTHGWPCAMTVLISNQPGLLNSFEVVLFDLPTFVNLAVGAIILVSVACICERLLRRTTPESPS